MSASGGFFFAAGFFAAGFFAAGFFTVVDLAVVDAAAFFAAGFFTVVDFAAVDAAASSVAGFLAAGFLAAGFLAALDALAPVFVFAVLARAVLFFADLGLDLAFLKMDNISTLLSDATAHEPPLRMSTYLDFIISDSTGLCKSHRRANSDRRHLHSARGHIKVVTETGG